MHHHNMAAAAQKNLFTRQSKLSSQQWNSGSDKTVAVDNAKQRQNQLVNLFALETSHYRLN